MFQTIAIVLALVLTVYTAYVLVKAIRAMLGVLRVGQPAVGRTTDPGKRWATMLVETFLHTRMFQWRWVGVMHWFVYFGFLILSSAVATGFVQLFDPKWQIWWIGHWFVYEWVCEGIGVLSTIGIVFLIVYRQLRHPRALGRGSRFFGSTFWQAYFVEFMALLEGAAILFIRGAEQRYEAALGEHRSNFHFPISHLIGGMYGDTEGALKNAVIAIALVKVLSALVWIDVIALNLTMGIAWHRFTAWVNIWFKRRSQGRDTDGATTALGAMTPLISGGKVITLDDIDELDEDATLGVGTIADFSWKGILDFTTCTECGRCQSQCPAWNTEKPLSPKLLMMGLREHAYAAAPYREGSAERRELPLIGKTDQEAAAGAGTEVLDWFYNPEDGGFVIDEDVLWSCTSCGACVQQCPVDIEHVDHIMDMRRYQVLVESNFPTELNGLFKGLENKGNPWNMSATARLDWAKDLPFEVKVVGDSIESLEEVDWLFWVGCAGAYEDRAKKTTRAVAELLDIAGVSFGVLGNGETCTGDPARRAGNEFVFQGLAQQNVETFKEYKVKKAVTTCAHCFNTLKNEYEDFGIELEVVHHTQLLNRLVREGRLTPVADGAGTHRRSITYHDPCYIGRHNGVYTPPRELLQVLPGAEYVEMPRNSERSFCCGAGGARMWMEERLGSRINRNRTDEAVGTGADQIAVGCPFCRVMLSDGLTAAQADGSARESVEVLDVAQMLLASVKGEQATKLLPGEGAPAGGVAAPAAKAAPATAAAGADVATKAEPSPGDVTITPDTVVDTADAGPAAKASQEAGGGSLFDAPAEAAAEPATPASAGSSLFDTPAPAEPAAPETPAAPAAPASGGSLFDEGGSLFDTPAPAVPAEPVDEEAAAPAEVPPGTPAAEQEPTEAPAAQPSTDLGASGSLFDIPAETPAEPKAEAAQPAESTESTAPTTPAVESAAPATETPAAPAAPVAEAAEQPSLDLGAGGSLFDIPAPAPTEPAPAAAAVAPVAEPTPPADPEAEAAPAAPETPSAPAAEAEAAPAETAPAEPAEAEAGPAEPAAATAAPVSSGAAHTPRTDVAIDELGSLFDIEVPAPIVAAPTSQATAPDAAPAAAAAAAAAAAPAATEPASAPEDAATEQTSTETATESAPSEASATEEAEPGQPEEPAPDDAPAAPAPTAPQPPAPSSGEAHMPRTDVDINGGGSLFDL